MKESTKDNMLRSTYISTCLVNATSLIEEAYKNATVDVMSTADKKVIVEAAIAIDKINVDLIEKIEALGRSLIEDEKVDS